MHPYDLHATGSRIRDLRASDAADIQQWQNPACRVRCRQSKREHSVFQNLPPQRWPSVVPSGTIGPFENTLASAMLGILHIQLISSSSFDGNLGKTACGSSWYQYATDEMSSCSGRYLPSDRHPKS